MRFIASIVSMIFNLFLRVWEFTLYTFLVYVTPVIVASFLIFAGYQAGYHQDSHRDHPPRDPIAWLPSH